MDLTNLRFSLIIQQAKTYVLPTSPDGWDKSLITVQRSNTYYGILRTFTVSMDFVLDGAKLLRQEFYQYGIEGNAQFKIEELQDDWTYKQIFLGDIDFSKIKDYSALDGYKFTCNVMQQGITALIAAYESTQFEIPFDSRALTVNMPGLNLDEMATLSIPPDTVADANVFFNVNISENQINAVNPSVYRVIYYKQATPNWATIDKFFFKANTNTTITSTKNNTAPGTYGYLTFDLYGTGATYYELAMYSNLNGKVKHFWDYNVPGGTTDHVTISGITVDMSFTYNAVAGEVLFLYASSTRSGGSQDGFYMKSGILQLSYQTKSPATNIKAFRPFDLYDSLIQKIYQQQFPGSTYPTRSGLLSKAPWNQLCITSGDAFRPGLIAYKYFGQTDQLNPGDVYTVVDSGTSGGVVTYNGHNYGLGGVFVCVAQALYFTATGTVIVANGITPAVIKTSFKDFFTSINAVLNAGFGDENGTAVIETKDYFFKSQVNAVTISGINKYELEPHTQFIFNTIKGGYPDQTYDITNGRLEINSETSYVTPITRVQQEYNIKSVYRADPFGMEFLRIQTDGSQTTKGDNEIFFVYIRATQESGQAYYQPEGFEAWQSVSGVPAGYYNLKITPKQNLLRHSSYIASMLYLTPGYIKLGSATKSTALVTVDLNGNRVSESDNITINTLTGAFFIPYIMTVETKLPDNILDLIDTFPTGKISFIVDGNTWEGYILKAEVDPARNTARSYQLLLTNNNNLTKFL